MEREKIEQSFFAKNQYTTIRNSSDHAAPPKFWVSGTPPPTKIERCAADTMTSAQSSRPNFPNRWRIHTICHHRFLTLYAHVGSCQLDPQKGPIGLQHISYCFQCITHAPVFDGFKLFRLTFVQLNGVLVRNKLLRPAMTRIRAS